jgi:hypothetical protein
VTISILWRGFAVLACRLSTPVTAEISATPLDDIDRAMANAQKILDGRIEGGPEIFYQKN